MSQASMHSAPAASAAGGGVPLVVDVDGTLVCGDLFWEGVLALATRRPGRIPGLLLAGLRGKAALKDYTARAVATDVAGLPLRASTLALIERARTAGQPVVLASGAHQSQVGALGERIEADGAWGSTAEHNLTGSRKLARVRESFEAFDYVGDSHADLPLWRAARHAFVVNAAPATLRAARRARPDIVELESGPRRWHALLQALRPHQWAKNLLLVVPALSAHLHFGVNEVVSLLLGFIAFSAVASAVYLVNDLADLPHDRLHEHKRRRPIAAGRVSVPLALASAVALLLGAALLAAGLPAQFQAVLAGYLVATTAYSLLLKRLPLIDVLTLAMMYASRFAAGAALVQVPLSGWFIAFSLFFFLSLALVKRFVELRRRPADETPAPGGRGYLPADLPVLSALGVAASTASSVVFCLYITDASVAHRYHWHDLLWFALPLLLYWQARVWLLAGRGQMIEDPVLFATRDWQSHLLVIAFLAIMALAR